MHQLPWVFSAFHWERAREQEREGEKEKKGGKKVGRERVEGEPRRIEKRSHRRRYVCKRGRDTNRDRWREREREKEKEREGLQKKYRIQSINVPESERAKRAKR